jgi:hypothetical protein
VLAPFPWYQQLLGDVHGPLFERKLFLPTSSPVQLKKLAEVPLDKPNFSTTPMQTPLSLALFWLLVATAGFRLVFIMGALTPVLASGDCNSIITIVGELNVNPWGLGSSTCITNAVMGLTSLVSFTYYLWLMQNGTRWLMPTSTTPITCSHLK